MKNLATLLRSGDLRPKERVQLLVRNHVERMRTGKAILTDADKYALAEGWKPRNNEEVREYNRYQEGANLMNSAIIDAQTTFLETQCAHFRKQPLILKLLHYPRHHEMRVALKRLADIKRASPQEAIEIADKQKAVKLQGGMSFDSARYQLAFETLSEEDQERMHELYPEVAYDQSYLNEEELIADLLTKDGTMSAENTEKLASLVSKRSYNQFTNTYQLYHYFACIPLAEVARHFLESKGISIGGKELAQNQEADDEDSDTHDVIQAAMETQANAHGVSIEAMLKEACLAWLHGDLFERYTPLAISTDAALFARWLAAKRTAEITLEKHIGRGELQVQGPLKVITGESLYALKTDWKFVEEFKQRVDRYEPNLGIVYADDDADEKRVHLDQELLLADAHDVHPFLSAHGLSLYRLSAFLEGEMYFHEVDRDGTPVLAFNEKDLEEIFIETTNDLVAGYATIRSYHELVTKLSAVYNVDVQYKTASWLHTLEGFIDAHNDALAAAVGDGSHRDKRLFPSLNPALRIDPALPIDKARIEPNDKETKEYIERFRALLGNEF